MSDNYVHCALCNLKIHKSYFNRHLQSLKHRANENADDDDDNDDNEEAPPQQQKDNEDFNYSENGDDKDAEEEDDFLSDLRNDKYESEEVKKQKEKEEKQKIKDETERMKLKMKEEKLKEQQIKRLEKGAKKTTEEDELFDEDGTEIIGKEKRELIKKISMFKSLFPEQLKKFRVKKKATVQELRAYYEEAEAIVSTETIDNFVIDGVLNSIKVVEGISANTQNFDITGLSDLLKANPHFTNLARQLYIKYSVFNQIPVEYQMVFVVASSAYLCTAINKRRKSISPQVV